MSRVIADTEPHRCLRMLSRIKAYERCHWRCIHNKVHDGLPHLYDKRDQGEAPLTDEPDLSHTLGGNDWPWR